MTDRKLIHAEALQPGALVRTPAGRTARVVELHDAQHEATVEWADHERARFKACHLKPEDEA